MTITRRSSGVTPSLTAADHLAEARAAERDGRIQAAMVGYETAIATAERTGELATLAESLRRISVIHHQQNEPDRSRELCRRCYATSLPLGDRTLAASALNTLGAVEFERGQMQQARELLGEALELGGARPDLRSRIEQNLGIIATIQGDHGAALGHYRSSLEA